jgi:predicted secreted protein
MFTDKRSKKVILVAHCILNQNAKINACAYYPGIIKEAMEVFLDAGVGLIQLPCPEFFYLGLDREVIPGAKSTIESEDTRVARRMNEKQSRELCQQVINNIVYQVNEYRKHDFEIVGLVGINCSPTCGVDTTWSDDNEHLGQGVFIKMLSDELAERQITMKMVGIKAREPNQAISAIKEMLYR